MGEKGTNYSRTRNFRSGRFLALGTTGFATAMTLLMVLAPASGVVLAPVYKNTVKTPSSYTSISGCASAKSVLPTWSPVSGMISGAAAAKAKTCGKSIGYVGGSSSAYASGGMTLAVPFKVSTGSHSIATAIKLSLASSYSISSPPCPTPNVAYPQPLNSYAQAYCNANAGITMYISASVIDITNTSWYSYNYSYGDAYAASSYYNDTYCYNYGTPACSNYTSASTYSYNYSYNAPGFTAFTWNGATAFTLWTNGTSMKKTDKYAVVLSVTWYANAYASVYNELGPWSGSGAAMLNMATLGNGMSVSSITIT